MDSLCISTHFHDNIAFDPRLDPNDLPARAKLSHRWPFDTSSVRMWPQDPFLMVVVLFSRQRFLPGRGGSVRRKTAKVKMASLAASLKVTELTGVALNSHPWDKLAMKRDLLLGRGPAIHAASILGIPRAAPFT
ncbi:hypothetical protein AOLI_G00203400 [Acnodon oligacanthus]